MCVFPFFFLVQLVSPSPAAELPSLGQVLLAKWSQRKHGNSPCHGQNSGALSSGKAPELYLSWFKVQRKYKTRETSHKYLTYIV